MKVRMGFVSNSSSSSFVLDAKKFPLMKVIEFVEKLVEASNVVSEYEYSLNDICDIYECEDLKEMNSRIIDWGYGEPIKFDGPVVIIDSTGDNSIPYPIQEAIEAIAITRKHWG